MERMQGRDLVTWALLLGILWELSRSASPAPARYGEIDSAGCCDPCGQQLNKNTQQASQTPYWVAQLGNQTGAPFIYEAN